MSKSTSKTNIDPRAWVVRTSECRNCQRSFAVCFAHAEQALRQSTWSRSVRRAASAAAADLLKARQERASAAETMEQHGPGSTHPWSEDSLRWVTESAERRAQGLERSCERRLAAVVDNDPAVIASIRSRFVVHYVLRGRRPHDRESDRGNSPYPCGTPDTDSWDAMASTRGVTDWRQVTCRRCLASRRELDRHHDAPSTQVCSQCHTVRSLAGECLC